MPAALGRDPDRLPRSPGDGDDRLRQAGPGPAAAEDPVRAGREVDGGGALARRPRQRLLGGARQALAALGAAHQRAADPEAGAARPLDRGPPLRRPQRRRFGGLGAAIAAQLLDQLAGVDPDRAGELAGAVGGAGVERVVLVLLEQGPLQRRAGWLARHLAPQDDPLARRRRQVAARADRLAEAALDAGRRRVLDLGRRLQVAEVGAGVAVENDARGEDAVGVGELLDPPHQLGRPLAPLALDVGRHVDPGPVLGLERAVVLADDQLDQLRHERLVAIEVLLFGEVRGEHEVEVSGRGVAGDAGEEAVLAEQRLEVAGALGDPLRRDADVLDDQRRPGRPHPPDQAVEALAHPPGELDLLGVAGEIDRADRRVGGEDLLRPGDLGVELGVARGPVLDQQDRRLRGQLFPLLGGADHVPGGGDQGRRDHQLDRGRAAVDQVADRRDRLVDAREVDPGGGRPRRHRHGLEDGLGDEGQGALGADEEAAEDLERLVGVEEGAEPVPGRVLDRELAPDPVAQLIVGPDLVADRLEPGGQLRLGGGEGSRRRRGRRCRSSSPTAGRRSASAPSSRSRG